MSERPIITTATGCFQPGLTGRIVASYERVVWLGAAGQEQRFTLPEFTVELAGGERREFCQYGRDFVFTPPTP